MSDSQPLQWPAQGISRVPYRVYTSEETYRREQERIFGGAVWARAYRR